MERSIKSILESALGLFLLVATVSVNAQTVGAGPYYATPSWDQTLPSNTRFIVLSNMNSEAVLDRETGLVWERTPSTSFFNWNAALFHCGDSNLGGRTGWRLPARAELLSLVDRSQSNPSLPAGHPFTVQSSDYWSASSTAGNSVSAWDVNFVAGSMISDAKTVSGIRAWCVRGGPGVDPQ